MNAYAQGDATDPLQLEEITVTGTYIRGIEPTGSQVIGISADDVKVSGATSANDILATLPQASNLFNGMTSLEPTAPTQTQVVRPNLRALPKFSTASGNVTLVLVDGHRVVPVGVKQSAVDSDMIPPAVIDRVEIITDGGSSLYGADAVGGVINFVTKKDFDGVEISAGYSQGDDYWSYDTSITAGTTWTNGSGYISLNHSDRDAILGQDRSWSKGGGWVSRDEVAPAEGECISPTSITSVYLNGSSVASLGSTGELCDKGSLNSLVPAEDRSSLFFGVTQSLTERISLDVKGFYSERNTTWDVYPLGDTVATREITGAGIEVVPTVGFSYAPNAAYSDPQGETTFEAWGLSPELKIDLDNGWRIASLLHYSESDSDYNQPDSNATKLQGYVLDGVIDPTNIAAAEANVIRDVLNWEESGESLQQLFMARVIADGALLKLPAGDLSMAIGVEYSDQQAEIREDNVERGGLSGLDYDSADRTVNSVFAELQVPLISGKPGIESLVLSASARYDDYSDFGDTTNPHVGLTWEPVEWLSIHANWGESFNAPTLVDQIGRSEAGYNAGVAGLFLTDTAAAAGQTIDFAARPNVAQLFGANDDLQPQTAETWAVGFTMTPPVAEGLQVQANYYEIEFTDILGFFDPRSSVSAVQYASAYTWSPTQAQLDAASAQTFNGDDAWAGVDASTVAVIIDRRLDNGDEALIRGLDFGFNYLHDSDLGTFDFQLSGNYKLESKVKSVEGNQWFDDRDNSAKYNLMSAVGWQRDNWRAKMTFKYTPSYAVNDASSNPANGEPLQDHVDAFLVTDLYVGYDFQGTGLTQDLSLRFNAGNVFDEEPPLYRRNGQASYSGFTLGRVLSISATKRF
nr:TonB-dependent receptor [Aestuariicella hydrocarbonica]